MQILIVDQQPLFIQGLSGLIRDLQPDAQLKIAQTLPQAEQQLQESTVDLLLLDLHLPDLTDIQPLTQLKPQLAAPIVIVSADNQPNRIRQCLEAGAAGYIPKQTEPELIRRALAMILAQGSYLPPDLLGALLQTDADIAHPELTDKQQQVLYRLLQGKPNKVIARELSLAEGTIKAHLWAVYQQLGVNSRLQAMAKAHELGLLPSAAHHTRH